ncbi:hypothetical protein [Streptomyces sp. NPDC054842]
MDLLLANLARGKYCSHREHRRDSGLSVNSSPRAHLRFEGKAAYSPPF